MEGKLQEVDYVWESDLRQCCNRLVDCHLETGCHIVGFCR